MKITISRAGVGDEETLRRCTQMEKATAMYRCLLEQNVGNGYILKIDGNPPLYCLVGCHPGKGYAGLCGADMHPQSAG